jgi:hypothetical protein
MFRAWILVRVCDILKHRRAQIHIQYGWDSADKAQKLLNVLRTPSLRCSRAIDVGALLIGYCSTTVLVITRLGRHVRVALELV